MIAIYKWERTHKAAVKMSHTGVAIRLAAPSVVGSTVVVEAGVDFVEEEVVVEVVSVVVEVNVEVASVVVEVNVEVDSVVVEVEVDSTVVEVKVDEAGVVEVKVDETGVSSVGTLKIS